MGKSFNMLISVLVVFIMLACYLPITITTPTLVPTVLATPTVVVQVSPFSDWLTYTNQNYNFELKYPPDGQISGQTDSSARIQLSIASNTNLAEKYLDITVVENVNPCSSPQAQGYAPGAIQTSQVTFNSLVFTLESGSDAGMGNYYEWTAYSTAKGIACVSIDFVLHSSNPNMVQNPPPRFDKVAESAVFAEIVSTFRWLTP